MDKSHTGEAAPPDYNAAVAPAPSHGSCSFDYIRSFPGMLKVGETALCFAALICGIVGFGAGAGWGGFVAGFGLAECIFLLVLHLTGLISRLPYNLPLWEFVSAIVNATFFFIAAVVCAVGGIIVPYAAYAFFGFAACLAFVVDSVLQFRIVQGSTGFVLGRSSGAGAAAAQSQPHQEPARY